MSLENEHKLAFGGDSSVYLIDGGEQVKKVYDGGPLCSPINFEKVQQYFEVSNRACSFALEKPVLITLGDEEYRVFFNGVTSVENEGGIAVTRAPYVEGQSLASISNIAIEARSILFRLSNRMNKSLGVEGISITPGNTMLCGGTLVVTDLCDSVRKLNVTPSGIEPELQG